MFRQIKWSSLLMAVAYIAAGILLIIYPEASGNLIGYVVGIGLCVLGVVQLTTYFLLNVRDSLFRNEFVIGVMLVIGGILVIVKQDIILSLVPIILGLIIVTSGIMKFQNAVVAYRIGYSHAIVYAILGLISIVLGIVVMFFLTGKQTQAVLFTTIGAGLVYCGISDLGAQLFLAAKFHAFMKAFEEAAKKNGAIDVEVTETAEEIPEEKE